MKADGGGSKCTSSCILNLCPPVLSASRPGRFTLLYRTSLTDQKEVSRAPVLFQTAQYLASIRNPKLIYRSPIPWTNHYKSYAGFHYIGKEHNTEFGTMILLFIFWYSVS
jgi:hypothetical protein